MPWNADDMCYFHMKIEPTTPTTFKVCGECFHAWPSEEAFLNDVFDAMFMYGVGLLAVNITADTETCCPLCSHDF